MKATLIRWMLAGGLTVGVLALARDARATTINVGANCTFDNAIIALNQRIVVGSCAAGNGNNDTIQFPASGTPFVAAGLNISVLRPVTIAGMGSASTTLRFSLGTHGDTGLLLNGGSAVTVTIRDITWTALNENLITGVRNESSTLIVTNARFTNFGYAGIHNLSTATVTGSTIDGNGFYGSFPIGGGILNGGGMQIFSSTIAGNSAYEGGGIASFGTRLTEVYSTTFDGNFGVTGGGYRGESAQMENCTFINNSAGDGGGGGIFLEAVMGGQYFHVQNVTIANNYADGVGGGFYGISNGATVEFNNNILFNNVSASDGSDIYASFHFATNFAGNLVTSAAAVVPAVICGQGPICGDPLFEPASSINNGPKFLALRPGSPAIDRATTRSTYHGDVDQRGFPRPLDGDSNGSILYDYGAFEYDPLQAEALTVAAKSSDSHTIVNDATYSNAHGTWLHSNATNDFVTYAVPVGVSGTYAISVRVRRGNDRARVQLSTANSLGGTYTARGSVQDHYSSSGNFVVQNLGTVTFSSAGTKYFRFQATGKNSSSSSYNMRFDYLFLTKQ